MVDIRLDRLDKQTGVWDEACIDVSFSRNWSMTTDQQRRTGQVYPILKVYSGRHGQCTYEMECKMYQAAIITMVYTYDYMGELDVDYEAKQRDTRHGVGVG